MASPLLLTGTLRRSGRTGCDLPHAGPRPVLRPRPL